MQRQLSWSDLQSFLAIARSGSLAGAARMLAVNHSTVFRRLNALEEQLGVRLFERHATGYAPPPRARRWSRWPSASRTRFSSWSAGC